MLTGLKLIGITSYAAGIPMTIIAMHDAALISLASLDFIFSNITSKYIYHLYNCE